MELKLTPKDLNRIGHITYWPSWNDGNTVFICNSDTANIEYIIVRSILNDLNFETKEKLDSPMEDSIEIATNISMEEYEKLTK
jgi:hypothetical protein